MKTRVALRKCKKVYSYSTCPGRHKPCPRSATAVDHRIIRLRSQIEEELMLTRILFCSMFMLTVETLARDETGIRNSDQPAAIQ